MPEEWKGIARASDACVGCEKPLRPGDELTSALYQEAGELLRRDFCPSCWEARRGGGEFSFWRRVVPEPEDEAAKKKRHLDAMLNPTVLFDIFKEMTDHPDGARRRFRFVLALMLMRRKKLKFLSIGRRRMADGEQDVLVLKQAGRGARLSFDVVDVKMPEEEMIAAQDEVAKLLAMGGVEVGLPEGDAASGGQDAQRQDTAGAGAPGEPAPPSGDVPMPETQRGEKADGDAEDSTDGC